MDNECLICLKPAHMQHLPDAKIHFSCERCGKYFMGQRGIVGCSWRTTVRYPQAWGPACLQHQIRGLSSPSSRFLPTIPRRAYFISVPVASSRELETHEKRHILSGAIRNLSEQGVKVEILTLEDIETILDSVSVPSDPFEAIDLLLKYLFQKTDRASEYVELNPPTDYSVLFAREPDDFSYYVQKALELGFIEYRGARFDYRLSLDGWCRLDELRKYERKSDQAFVAMWFDPRLDEVWENGFKVALKGTGYNPIRVDLTEHNEKICDRIIVEIRKSGLVVADFTGQRGGVYFEAGFAMGLGIPVIWTCRDTDVEKLHFDTRQYNHIVWSDSADLKETG